MKAYTFTELVTVTDEEHKILTEVNKTDYLFKTDFSNDLIDSLCGKGLCDEVGEGILQITTKGRRFLNNCI